MTNQFKCGRCGTLIDYGTTCCPQCGRTFQYAAQKKGPSRSPHFPSTYDADETTETIVEHAIEHKADEIKDKSTNRILWMVIALLSTIILIGAIYFLFIRQSGENVSSMPMMTSQYSDNEESLGEVDDEYIGEDADKQYSLWTNMGKRSAQGTNDRPRKVIINGEGVRLRFKPSLDAEYLKLKNGRTRSVPKGTALEYVGETKEWYKVKYQDKTYYVSKQFSYIKKDKKQ